MPKMDFSTTFCLAVFTNKEQIQLFYEGKIRLRNPYAFVQIHSVCSTVPNVKWICLEF